MGAATQFVDPALFLTTVVDTAGTAVAGQREDGAAGGPALTCVTGPTGGTLAATAIRRFVIPGVIGSGIMWLFPESSPLIVPVSLSAVIRNDGAVGPAISWVVVWSEV